MKHTLLIALVTLSLSAPVMAADYFVVVPMPGKVVGSTPAPDPVENITVSLNAYALPVGTVNTAYSFNLNSVLDVQGDAAFNADNVAWSVVAGEPPVGIALQADGTLSGLPTVKNEAGASFEVKASYKGKDGQQVYTIVVNGVELQVTQIAAGGRYTCAVTAEGAAKCWGRNNEGQLGDGTGVSSLTPVAVMGLPTSVTKIASGAAHTCAIASEGALYCWGHNPEGKLGTGDKLSRYSAVRVTGIAEPVRQVSTGSSHTCVVTTAGRALCWGFNGDGRLGVGNFTEQLTPVTVSGMASGAQQVAAGGHLSCAVTTSGAAKCWGNNHLGQLGNGGGPWSSIPVDVTGLSSGVAHIEVGLAHACARLNTGSVRCWGANDVGQLGDGSFTQRNSPVAVSTLTGIATIDIGWNHTCALTATGELYCWGVNELGQLGDGTQTVRNTPGAVPQLGAVSILSAGMYHTCAAALASAPKCWGSNDMGQLGDGTTVLRTTPVSVRNK